MPKQPEKEFNINTMFKLIDPFFNDTPEYSTLKKLLYNLFNSKEYMDLMEFISKELVKGILNMKILDEIKIEPKEN